jgi:hypothetical protein
MQAKIQFNMDNNDFILYPNSQVNGVMMQIRDAILKNMVQEPADQVGVDNDDLMAEFKPFSKPLHDNNGNIIGEVKVE